MSDEDKKKIVSEPPPPTDEIDSEWAEDSTAKAQPQPPAAGSAKAAEASTPPEMKAASSVKAAEHSEEEEQDEDESDSEGEHEAAEEEDEEEEEDDEEHAAEAPHAVAPATDWLPDWAPYAVLAALVSISVLFGLGLVGGHSTASADEGDQAADAKAAEPKAAVKAPAKPGAHP